MKRSNYKVVQQNEEYDCAAACVATILKSYFSLDVSIFEIKPIIKNGESGTSFSDLFNGLKRLGINGKLYKAEKKIEAFDQIKYPIITQIRTEKTYHFIVIFSYSSGKLIIGDPGESSPQKISVKNFLKNWVPFLIFIDVKNSNLKITQNSLNSKISIWSYIKLVKYKLLFVALTSFITYAIGILLSGMFNLYFDVIIPQKFAFLVTACLVIYLIVLVFNSLLQLLRTFGSNNVSKIIDKNLLISYFKGILSKPRYAINEYDSAELLTDITNISVIRNKILATVVQIPVDLVWVLVSLKILYETNQKLTIATIIMLLILLYVTILPMKHYEVLSKKMINSMTKFNNYLIDHIENMSVIRELKVVDFFIEQVGKKYENLLIKRNKTMNFDAIINELRQIISNGFTIVLFSLGSIDIINGNLTTGSLLMFNSILGYTTTPLLEITEFQSLLIQGKVATNRINSALTQLKNREEISQSNSFNRTKIDEITFNDVYFSFDNKHELLQDVNFSIKGDINVAIIGDNGSGKTTIGKLISKLLLRDSGNITFNQVDIETIPEDVLDNKIIFIDTSERISNGTILDNIVLRRNVTKKRVLQIAEQIGFLQDITRNGIGIDTLVGSNGTKLSFGQVQMIKILQSTVVPRDIYVFDEITNGLDQEHKKAVIEYLIKLPGIKIFLTHDETLVSRCNQVLLVNNGKVEGIK